MSCLWSYPGLVGTLEGFQGRDLAEHPRGFISESSSTESPLDLPPSILPRRQDSMQEPQNQTGLSGFGVSLSLNRVCWYSQVKMEALPESAMKQTVNASRTLRTPLSPQLLLDRYLNLSCPIYRMGTIGSYFWVIENILALPCLLGQQVAL